MDIKAQIMQALMSGKDPAEALRLSLLEKIASDGSNEKLNNMIESMTKIINFKLISNNDIPYNKINDLLADYDDIKQIYNDYPNLESSIRPLVKLIETRDKINLQ